MEIKITLFLAIGLLMALNTTLTHLINWFYRKTDDNNIPIVLAFGVSLIRWLMILGILESILENKI